MKLRNPFKKKQKWFEVQGTLLESRWAKNVIKIESVFRNAWKKDDYPFWGVAVILNDNSRERWMFNSEQEAAAAYESLVNWIKEVQS